MREGSLAVGSNREPQIPEMGRVGNTSPRWVPFAGLTPVVLQRPRSGSIDREAPHGASDRRRSTYRSISPESHG